MTYILRAREDRTWPTGPWDGSPIRADTLGSLPSEAAVAEVPIRVGRTLTQLGDLFEIEGEPGLRVVLSGPPRGLHQLAAGMARGELDVIGDAGDLVAVGMTGGRVRIRGSVGHSLGAGMSGGQLLVEGDAGDEVGGPPPSGDRGLSGGEILVRGRAGGRVGYRQRGGLIACGQLGPYPAHAMIAGTVLAVSGPLVYPGAEIKRGTIVSLDRGVEHALGPNWSVNGRFRPVILRVLLGRLAQLGFELPAGCRDGQFQQWSGDRFGIGRAEVFVWLG